MAKRSYQWRLHPPPPPPQLIVSSAIAAANADADDTNNNNNNNKTILFANNTKFTFHLNDNVYIRPKSTKEFGISGRIVDIVANTSAAGMTAATTGNNKKRRKLLEDRVSIQPYYYYCHVVDDDDDDDDDDKTNRLQKDNYGDIKTNVRASRLFPIYNTLTKCTSSQQSHQQSASQGEYKEKKQKQQQTEIIITPDTTNYRQLASSHILHSSDKVLEIGCSTGECTALVLRRLMLLYKNEHQQKVNDDSLKDSNKQKTINDGIEEESSIKEKGKESASQQQQQQQQLCRPHIQIVAFDTGFDMIEQAKQRVHAEFNAILDGQQQTFVDQSKEEEEEEDSRGMTYEQMVQFYKVDAIANPRGAYSHATRENNNIHHATTSTTSDNFITTNSSNEETTTTTRRRRRTPNVILIDIGGNRELRGVISMIQWVQSYFNDDSNMPRLVIVKSEALVNELTIKQKQQKEKGNEKSNSTIKNEGEEHNMNMVTENGIINNGQEWFTSLLQSSSISSSSSSNIGTGTSTATTQQRQQQAETSSAAAYYTHPLKAPLVLSPIDDKTPICRFYNYMIDGCKNAQCPYDHIHCHVCLKSGHRALDCGKINKLE